MHVPARYRSSVTEAKQNQKPAPEPATTTAVTTEQAPDQPEQPAESDVRRKFREALERKNATPGTHPGSQADGGNQMKSSNGKRKREFRRKSGG
jgi:hypothetical protein